MIKLKVCPRCRGDVYLTEDIYGKYLSCLQCGYLRDLVNQSPESIRKRVLGIEGQRKAA